MGRCLLGLPKHLATGRAASLSCAWRARDSLPPWGHFGSVGGWQLFSVANLSLSIELKLTQVSGEMSP